MSNERIPDPTIEQIAERCAEIQNEWSPAERMRRLRCDLRPQVRCADGSLEQMTVESMEIHQAACEALQDD